MILKALGFSNLIIQYGRMMGYPDDSIMRYQLIPNIPLQGILGKMDMDLGVIEKMEQKMAVANGITLHYPYINQEFAEYCYMLPDHLKIRNGVTKWAFREVCRKYLPEFVMDRAKMGGPVAPVNHWIDGAMENGEFSKEKYLQLQKDILYGQNNTPNA
jgi:asparagine synthetase B (glutamine-hydrolysing)